MLVLESCVSCRALVPPLSATARSGLNRVFTIFGGSVMRNVVVGSFIGFVLAAAFLAACGGSSSEDGGPTPVSTPGTVTWSALGAQDTIATGINLTPNVTWSGTAEYDNAVEGRRDQYAAFTVAANVDTLSGGAAVIDVGVLAAPDGVNYATDPQWLGTVEMSAANNRRAVLSNVRIPPTRCKFALRLRGESSASARVTSFRLTPYNEQVR